MDANTLALEFERRLKGRKLYTDYSDVCDVTLPIEEGNRGAYPWQVDFHNAGADHPERLVMAGNRCITPWTKVETASGSRPILELLHEKAFDVHSWHGESRCVAEASGVFLKGIEPTFHVLLDSGEVFQSSRKHRVLTSEGWLSLDQLIHTSNGLRWKQTIEDFRANCGVDDYRDDSTLLLAVGNGPEALPLTSGVQILVPLVFSRAGAAARISQHSHVYPDFCQSLAYLDSDQIVALCDRFQDPSFCIDALCKRRTHQEFLRCANEFRHLKSNLSDAVRQPLAGLSLVAESGSSVSEDSFEERRFSRRSRARFEGDYCAGEASLEFGCDAEDIEIFYPSNHISLTGGSRIVAVVPIGYQPIMDFTVKKTKCYFAGGVIHHNTGKTTSGGAETAIHLTGLYPDWWRGKRFHEPVTWWTGAERTEDSKDVIQHALLGSQGEHGTGWIPADRREKVTYRQAGVSEVIDKIYVKHSTNGVMDGISECTLKTYQMEAKAWRGKKLHGVWLDEECKMEIYTEAITRVLDNRGIVYMTFTPLEGPTEVVAHFMDGGRGIYVKNVSWDDAPHLDEDEKNRLYASYPAHERDTRKSGQPLMGTGLVFPISDDDLSVLPFEIPNHWRRINGIDFGIDHPGTCAYCAYDADADTFYVYDCYKKTGETAVYHAAAIKKHGNWIPVAWPHDGFIRDKGNATPIKNQFKGHGVKMLSDHALHNQKHGMSREAGLVEMYEYMRSGRFKVFSTCREWFEEKRMYHRKDAKVVDKFDDIMSGTRYAFVARRFAQNSRPVISRRKRPRKPVIGGNRWKVPVSSS